MPRETVEPTKDEQGYETHPAFGLIGVSRLQVGGRPGAVLFDSDIHHAHTVRIQLHTARRKRDLNRDWIGVDGRAPVVEVEMSEAQWASFVSSFSIGDGVPCTIRARMDTNEYRVPELPFAPRMAESMAEVRGAAEAAIREVAEAFETYDAHRIKRNRDRLKYAIKNLPSNITFAAKSLTEHAEGVVEKSKADLEAFAVRTAQQLGIEPGDLGIGIAALEAPPDEDGENGG